MKKQGKLFSLIKEGDIHLAPGHKIIPNAEVEVLLSSKEIQNRVSADAEDYRKDVVIEMEFLKERSQAEGFESGLEQWAEQVALLEEEIKSNYSKIGKTVLPIAMKAAKKIVGEELQLHKDSVVNVIATALKSVAQHKKIVIYVSKDDLETVEAQKERLKAVFESLESLSIQQRNDVEVGGCIIETERGIINAQLSSLWQKLELAFQKVMQK